MRIVVVSSGVVAVAAVLVVAVFEPELELFARVEGVARADRLQAPAAAHPRRPEKLLLYLALPRGHRDRTNHSLRETPTDACRWELRHS